MNPFSPEYKAAVLETGLVHPLADIYSGKLLYIFFFSIAKFQRYSKLIEICLKSNSYVNFMLAWCIDNCLEQSAKGRF
jgi:hypothetical protein